MNTPAAARADAGDAAKTQPHRNVDDRGADRRRSERRHWHLLPLVGLAAHPERDDYHRRVEEGGEQNRLQVDRCHRHP